MIKPLVSIGIPTYNRPAGLRRTLECIVNQSYQNLEIIVSDNASPGTETQMVVEEFCQNDSRIKYFRQHKNEGALFNLTFVREKSTANYFMWAADDDYFESKNLVEKLIEQCVDNILVFPDFNILNGKTKILSNAIFHSVYQRCASERDYLLAWSKLGLGYPTYGLYNLTKFNESKLSFQFDNDVSYYSEGIFLHRIFLAGKVKFVPNVFIQIAEGGSIPSNQLALLKDLVTYTRKSILLYLYTDRLSIITKLFVLSNFVANCSYEMRSLSIQLFRDITHRKDLLNYIIFNWVFWISLGCLPLYKIVNLLRNNGR